MKAMTKLKVYKARALKMGAEQALIIPAQAVVTRPWVRLKCQYGCGCYNRRLTCPPFSPTPDYTQKLLQGYKTGIFFTYSARSEKEEVRLRRRMRRSLARLEREIFLDGYYRAFGMAAGPCNLCRTCNITSPCKYPEIARPAMEACGIDVYQTAKNVGIQLRVVRTPDEPATYCCLILVE